MEKEVAPTTMLSTEVQWWLGIRSIILTLLFNFFAIMIIGQLMSSLGLPLAPVTRGLSSDNPSMSLSRVLMLLTAGGIAGAVGTTVGFRLALRGQVQRFRPWLVSSLLGWSLMWLFVILRLTP